jgi:predicted aspartyl protease
MSVFSTKLVVWNPVDPARTEEIEVWVDTGASYSWVARARLETLGIRSTRRMTFRTIEGRSIERELAAVFVRVDGYTGGDTLVLAEPGDAEVLGAHTLESLGLTVDPVKKELVPTVGLALLGRVPRTYRRRSGVLQRIDKAAGERSPNEPFS